MTLRALLLFLPLFLFACTRPLSEGETAFSKTLFGENLQTRNAVIHNGAFIGNITHTRATRPRKACRERIWPAPKAKTVKVGTAAFVLFNAVFVARPLYKRDYLASYPDHIKLTDTMLFAHEMTHIWQWQNRAVTGYHPLKAASEHKPGTDPYLFELTSEPDFLDFPFEQQAGIVEEYVCCSTLDPNGRRTARLREMLGGYLPISDLDKSLAQSSVTIPWKGAKISGICG